MSDDRDPFDDVNFRLEDPPGSRRFILQKKTYSTGES